MLFSELYQIKRGTEEDWFDPILDIDTKLFIDPFLLFKYSNGHFANCHDKIIKFFNEAFMLAAKGKGVTTNLSYKKLLGMLTFPEVDEICLGYTNKSTKGAGSGIGFSKNIGEAIAKSIQAGLKELDHFEEIGILEEGIGADRISDICGNIIKDEIIKYTKEICERHNVPLEEFKVKHAAFNFQNLRWEDNKVFLPKNPFNDNPVLLLPLKILRDLPTINANGFLDWAWTNENELLRTDFNYEVKNQLKKEDIIRIATERTDLLEEYIKFIKNKGSYPYNLLKDPNGIYKWYEQSKTYTKQHPINLPVARNTKELAGFVKVLIEGFRTFIINNSGYKLLWNDNPKKPKKEEASQLLFHGLMKEHCKANNVDFSREVNSGRGPVDFKFSNGYTERVLIEVKRASSTKLEQGLTQQLPQYLTTEGIDIGYYVVIVQKDEEFKKVSILKGVAKKLSEELNKYIDVFVIDATDDKPSASNLKGK
ncbi:hypothetical protein [Domibacillus enclensis]|uniref:Uncharacterized protein n=1 Tax=Domibacillus enclensis TaxID=1017273 RepID=A0A1N7AT63_9BACI|nr:hypothetical protein [Domibacillus enclensis]OXS75076.1 hypothetical protein B1B05_15180 [Domibacillus enclensis]SIR42357.1 hypothetical protein SAMN05443094_10825 [Domibacillus enclensis]